jgi:hypothetical protein
MGRVADGEESLNYHFYHEKKLKTGHSVMFKVFLFAAQLESR